MTETTNLHLTKFVAGQSGWSDAMDRNLDVIDAAVTGISLTPGPEGPVGPEGPIGPTGAPGSDATFPGVATDHANGLAIAGTVTLGADPTSSLQAATKHYVDVAIVPVTHVTGLAPVATSGSYSDLTAKPAIPTVPTLVSAFTNDASYLTPASVVPAAKVSGLAPVATSGVYTDLTARPVLVASATVDTTNANNISSGTLAHARLPALVSGDIPSNAANTTGTAANITGAIPESQVTGLVVDLAAKAAAASLAAVATSGSYTDLTSKPSIPTVPTVISAFTNDAGYLTADIAQVNSDWNAVTGVAVLLNKPALAPVATSGSYTDLSNKPTIAGQVNADWTAGSGTAQILNKPVLATVATSGSYTDLTAKPTIPTVPTVVSAFTNDAGYLTPASNVPATHVTGLATVATSGSYPDLLNPPVIPAAQVSADWNSVVSPTQVLNKPTLGTAAAQNTSAFDAAGAATAVQANLAIEVTRATTAEGLLVAKTLTINTHALSSNVIVSASDLTTGTLPHGQLPPLVSGDIPNNAANTSGTAAGLSASIAESQVISLVSDLAAKAATSSLAPVALSGVYTDLTGKPTIPAAQVSSDWTSVVSPTQILNKPVLGTAAAMASSAFDASGVASTVQTNLTSEITRATTAEGLLVPKTVTVNAHALSANVVVSASDLTTGTLPHNQLPALVSGDIPNNAANTSGTAAGLSANIAESQVTNLATDLAAKVATSTLVALGTGLVKVTTGTGVLSTAVAADIPNIAESQVTNLATDLAAKVATATLAALSTGIVKVTTGTGAVSTAVAADFPPLNQNTTGSAASLSAVALPVQTSAVVLAGPIAPTTPYSYWRINFLTTTASSCAIGEIGLRTVSAGASVATGGSATAQTVYGGTTYPAANAFDGSGATFWASQNNAPQWIQYQLTSAQTIVEFYITSRTGAYTQAPLTFNIQGCNDGVSWVTIQSYTTTWIADGTQTFSVVGTSQAPTFRALVSTDTPGVASLTGVNTLTAPGAASVAALTMTGAVYTGGTGTTTYPYLYINQGAAASTFSTSGTIIGVNAVGGFSGNLLDLRVGGTNPVFSVTGGGVASVNGTGTLYCSTLQPFNIKWQNNDLSLSRMGANSLGVGNGASGDVSGSVTAGTVITNEASVTQLATPVNATHTVQVSGGSLAAGTYWYRVAAVDSQGGSTLTSTETSIVVASGSVNTVTVKWTVVPGATGYKVYGRTTGAELLIATVTGQATSSYIDTGSITPAGALPVLNTTGSIVSTGQVALSGSGTASLAAFQVSGTPFTGGTATTTFPHALISATGASAVTSWATTGTMLGMNAGSGWGGNLIDLHVNGGASLFIVGPFGSIYAAAGIKTNSAVGFQLSTDTNVSRPAAGIVALGNGVAGDQSAIVKANQLLVNELTVSSLTAPTNTAFATSTTGGTLAPGTYYYRVAATDAAGTTLASGETSQVVPAGTSTNTVTVNWFPIVGATGYKVYGRTIAAELFMANVSLGTTGTWLDTGSITPAGALPSLNTTGVLSSQVLVGGLNTVTYSATPVLSASCNTNVLTLTGNVTSSTLAAGVNGQQLSVMLIQDATGSRTWTWPTTTRGGTAPSATANLVSTYNFVYVLALALWVLVSSQAGV